MSTVFLLLRYKTSKGSVYARYSNKVARKPFAAGKIPLRAPENFHWVGKDPLAKFFLGKVSLAVLLRPENFRGRKAVTPA